MWFWTKSLIASKSSEKDIFPFLTTEYFPHIYDSALGNTFESHPWVVDGQMDKTSDERQA